jgi:hypothetical protein
MIDEAIAGKIMTVGVAYSDEWFYPISFCHYLTFSNKTRQVLP